MALILDLFFASLIVADLTFLFGKASIFEPLRKSLRLKLTLQKPKSLNWWLWGYTGELLNCAYCLSHWLAVLVVIALGNTWTESAILFLPSVWIGNCLIALYYSLSNINNFLPGYMQYLQIIVNQGNRQDDNVSKH